MRTRSVGHKGKLRHAVIAVALGLGVAVGGAQAKPPSAGNSAGNKGAPADLAALLEEISMTPEASRRQAADAFVTAAVGAEMADVMAAAVPALDDSRADQRYYALTGLGAAGLASTGNGEELSNAAQALVDGLSDQDASVRVAAAAALAAIQPGPPDWAAGPLTDLLDDPEPRVASAAMRALERLSASYVGLDAVYAALDSENPADRSRAVRVLGALAVDGAGETGSAWALAGALRDPDANVRWQAATALGGLGGAGVVGLRDLHAVSRNRTEDPAVRRAAAMAIDGILN